MGYKREGILSLQSITTTHHRNPPPAPHLGRLPSGGAEPPVPHKGPGTASYHLSPFPRLRPCVAWQGSKEMGDHPATQLRRLCPGDVRASGGSVLLVPMITLCTGDLEECVRGAAETGELRMSSSSVLRQRDPELYVITKTHGYKAGHTARRAPSRT